MHNIEDIYKSNFNLVYKYLVCLTQNENVAEELTQETFYRAVKYINSFKGQCKMSVWLCQIAKHLWSDELKKQEKTQYLQDIDNISLENFEENIFNNDEKKCLYSKIKRLDKTTQEVILFRIIGELSFKEIANILNKTENWARVTFYRGKQKMKGSD